jgi:redox-sensing transcriptional repressor
MGDKKVSDAVIRRLVIYMRVLDEILRNGGGPSISSHELGKRAGVRAAQVRKDLTCFGEFGKQGVGYNVEFLRNQLHLILHLEKDVNMAIVGAGHLGLALARYNIERYRRETDYYLKVTALFDNNPRKVNQVIEGIAIYHVDALKDVVREKKIVMGVISVPGFHAQEVADTLIDAGVRAILNFAPTTVMVSEGVRLQNADLSLELQHLAYYLGR